jgi:hypothetical protein
VAAAAAPPPAAAQPVAPGFTVETNAEVETPVALFFDADVNLYTGRDLNPPVTGLGTSPLAFGPGGAFGSDLYALNTNSGEFVRIAPDKSVTSVGTGFPTSVGGLVFGPDRALYLASFDGVQARRDRRPDRRRRPEPAARRALRERRARHGRRGRPHGREVQARPPARGAARAGRLPGGAQGKARRRRPRLVLAPGRPRHRRADAGRGAAVRVEIGETCAALVPASAFTRQGDRFGAKGEVGVVLDYLRETVSLKAKGVELGAFAEGPNALRVESAVDDDARASTVRAVRKGTSLRY